MNHDEVMVLDEETIDYCKKHIKSQGKCDDPSDLAVKSVYILNRMYQGLHHCYDTLHRVKKENWTHPYYFECTVYGTLDTWDFNLLTKLVILCHDLCIRCEVCSCSPRYLKLCFGARKRINSYTDGHPTMEQAIEQLRDGVKFSDQWKLEAESK
ncbi:MAG: hypothetical protein ACYC27_02980 [Armatimonadota bacterium]